MLDDRRISASVNTIPVLCVSGGELELGLHISTGPGPNSMFILQESH